MMHRILALAALVTWFALISGCGKEPIKDGNSEAKSKQVTVDVRGMS